MIVARNNFTGTEMASLTKWRVMTEEETEAAHPFSLRPSALGYVPFSVRYGFKKISDWARKTDYYPAKPGLLWELFADRSALETP